MLLALIACAAMLNPNPLIIPGIWTPEQRADANIQARVARAKICAKNKDILGWGRNIFPEKFPIPFSDDLHNYFVSIRGDEITSTVAPRGHGKTIIRCCLIPMFQALEEPETFDYYAEFQSTHQKGVGITFAIKNDFENNPALRRIYGSLIGLVKWTDEIFMLPNGVVFQGAGAGDSIRGMQFMNRRPNAVILDDLYDTEDIGRPEAIQAKNDWFWGSLYPARAKGKRTSFHVQGTVAGDNDLMIQLGEMAKTDKAIKHREFPAIIQKTGKPLWKELNTLEELEIERNRMGDVAFNRENLGDRSSRGTSIIKAQFLSSWRQPPSAFKCDGVSDPYRMIEVIVGVDPSVGKKQANNPKKLGDPAAYARVWKLLPTNMPGALPVYFIDSIINKCLGMQERIDAAKDMVTTARPDRRVRRIRVETIAGFDDIGTLIARAVAVPCEKVAYVVDKMLNLEKKQPFFQNGRVFINDQLPIEIIKEVEKQLTNNKPQHDDIRDAIFLTLSDENPSMKSWV